MRKNDLQDLPRQTLSSPKRNPWIGHQLEAWLKKHSHAADRPAIADGPKNVGVSQAETKNNLQVSATGISKGFGRVHTLKEALWYTMLLKLCGKNDTSLTISYSQALRQHKQMFHIANVEFVYWKLGWSLQTLRIITWTSRGHMTLWCGPHLHLSSKGRLGLKHKSS